jgi:hypothetical protein
MEDIRGSVVAAFLNIALRVYPDLIRHTLITKKMRREGHFDDES